VALGGALAASPLIAACSSPAPPTTSSGTPGGKIVVGSFQDPGVLVLKQTFLPRFTHETGIQVQYLETDYNTWYQKAQTDAQSGAGAYDVLILDDPWVPQFAGSGLLLNMTQHGYQPDADFVTSLLELGYWPPRQGPVVPSARGKTPEIFALPIIGDTEVNAYRKDIFTTPPQKWDDIVSMAKSQGNPSGQKYGWVFRGAKGNPVVTAWFPTLYSFGGQMFDDNWHVTFNNDISVQALDFQLSLLDYCPPNIGEFDSDQEGHAFISGQAFSANLWTGWCHNAVDPSQSQVVDKIGFTVPPARQRAASEIGIFIAGVSKASKNPQGSIQFLKWFTSTPIQLDYARAGGVPVKVPVFSDQQAATKAPFLPAVRDTLAVAVPRPRTPDWAQVEDMLGTQLNLAIVEKGSRGSKAYLDAAAQQATQLLQQHGYYS
jgi:multiple sugar transport system substrate-binding protein